jgi:hypothetical protein
MNPDSSVEKPSKVRPEGKSPIRIKSLMVMVAVVALGLGYLTHTVRTLRLLQADESVFKSWVVKVERDNPTLKRAGMSFRSNSSFFELSRSCDYTLVTPVRKTITIQLVLRRGPFSSVGKVTFDSADRSVTWPFEEIQRGRPIDLKAEFPEAFR